MESNAGKKIVYSYVLKKSRKNLVKGLYVFRADDLGIGTRTVDNYVTIAHNEEGYHIYNEFGKEGIVVKRYRTNQYIRVEKNQAFLLDSGDEIYFEIASNKAIGIECGGKKYSFIRMARFMEEKHEDF